MGAQVFDTCALTFGYDAIWNDGSEDISGRVLFADPDQAKQLPGAEITYDDESPIMEFKPSDFPGLEDVIKGNGVEEINIDGQDYYVRDGKRIADGRLVKCKLQLKE